MQLSPQISGQQSFSAEGQRVNVLGFVGNAIFVATQVGSCDTGAGRGRVPITKTCAWPDFGLWVTVC